jgi:FlaA1/EpsC-like NDP-sugar epimerase
MGRTVRGSRAFYLLQRWRYPLSAAVDALLWYPALLVAVWARLDFVSAHVDVASTLLAATIAATVQLVSGQITDLYRGRRPIASFSEVRLVVLSSLTATVTLLLVDALPVTPRFVPLSTVLAAGAYQVLGALGIRYGARLVVEATSRSAHHRSQRTLIFGAGDAGDQISRALLEDAQTDIDPVAFLDDDPTKQRLVLNGIRVVGTRADMSAVARRFEADTLLIALAGAPQAIVNEVVDAGQGAGLAIKILPSAHALTQPTVRVKDIRDLEMTDFLNRDEVGIDDAAVRTYISGKRVLVTGAGGSIGSVLCRAIRSYEPARLIMVDRDENALHRLQVSLEGRPSHESPDLVLCDIRDRDALNAVFEAAQPDVVFHAAAHKHVTFLEQHPAEAFKTNVRGTINVLDAASQSGTERFINISTDKAADPVNVLGTSKRIAEQVTAAYNDHNPGRYLSVRFGNVLGSNGSVIPTFLQQIDSGLPITVTHPEVTRYFMTTEEAVLLVLQAGACGEGGDVLVLDMGEPVKIMELAQRLSRQVAPGRDVEITYTGLRPGEKLHEVLVSAEDVALGKPHERLSRFGVPPLDPELVAEGSVTSIPERNAEGDDHRMTIDLTDAPAAVGD